MNSIFLRIYVGILLAEILVALIAYGAVQAVNASRAEEYREQMARGTFYLMAQGLDRQSNEQDRERWRQVLTSLMGAEISLVQTQQQTFSRRQEQALAQGQVVMQLADDQSANIYYQLQKNSHLLVHTRMVRVSEQQARATAILILDELAQSPMSEWDREFERIQRYFGYPLTRVAFTELGLDIDHMRRLSDKQVVVAIDEGNSNVNSSVRVFAPMGNTGQVLVIGPLRLFERYPVNLLVIVGLLALLATGFAAYLLVRPLQSRLHHVGEAVKELSRGNLNAQVEVVSNDAVGTLAATFNGMAAHIRRLIESQREIMRAVSHELRTPVARLRFGIEMLVDTAAEEDRQHKAEALDRDIDELDTLIDEILTFARLEEGSPQLEFQQVSIPALLFRIKDEMEPISRGIEVRIDEMTLSHLSAEELPVQASERYLHRVLQNLVTNALRYAKSWVEIRYRLEDDTALLEVEDNGPGIPLQARERVFKPFARLDESRQRTSGGYGLGLSIVQRIVEWHGGQIVILAGREGGALFRMAWPKQRQEKSHVLTGNRVELDN